MNEGVVERGVNVCNTEDKLSLSNLRTERNSVFVFGDLDFLGRLYIQRLARNPPPEQTKTQKKVAIDAVSQQRTLYETIYAPFWRA
jgi:hypothetical protein